MRTWSVIEAGLIHQRRKEFIITFIIYTLLILNLGFVMGYTMAFLQY